MTSSITTATINSIDNTYPKSGQNNSTQGFRDNFTRIRENFQYAKDDIETLQWNAASVDQNTSTTVSLLTHTTYFTIDVDPIIVNLASGTDGQEKVLCVADITASAASAISAGAGNISPITVTVSNAGWVTGGNVGSITLKKLGDGVTVQFVNGRWVCSGNNNAEII